MFDWVLNTHLILDSAFLLTKTPSESNGQMASNDAGQEIGIFPQIQVVINFFHELHERMVKEKKQNIKNRLYKN